MSLAFENQEGLRGRVLTHLITSQPPSSPASPQPPLVLGNHKRGTGPATRPQLPPGQTQVPWDPGPFSLFRVPPTPAAWLPASSRGLSDEQPEAKKQAPLLPTPHPRAGAPGPGDRAELPTSCATPASQVCLPGPRFPYLESGKVPRRGRPGAQGQGRAGRTGWPVAHRRWRGGEAGQAERGGPGRPGFAAWTRPCRPGLGKLFR